ncbi:MAG: efflux transporter outer membrane subunit [Halioglobus sp.]|nr:efflux transporter outer membrane subunit [Halioglobus sp.]
MVVKAALPRDAARSRLWRAALAAGTLLAASCTSVGPDFQTPVSPLAPDWYETEVAGFAVTAQQQQRWWELLGDPALNQLIDLARQSNNTLEIAGLRVLEARAQLALAAGAQYPQSQVLTASASALGASENAANTQAGDLRYTQYDSGTRVSWEIDFWGRFRRGVEAADAAYRGTVAAYDEAMIVLAAQVASAYLAIRSRQEQLQITRDNIASQQRSFDIVNVQFRNGNTSELDVLQARALLLSTRAVVPVLEADLRRARHALSALLGRPPGAVAALLDSAGGIPVVPERLAIGLPADLLRRRPDVRRAEFQAMARNAQVGMSTANLYPRFSLSGTLGLVAAGNTGTTLTGDSGGGALFDSDSLNYSAGVGMVWPFFNYGRIRNDIRVQDARLQQALTGYRETVIQAAREVEDALAALHGARVQEGVLQESVAVSRRARDVALLRFREGFADYQRVLDAQQVLFSQQGRLVSNRSSIVGSFIALYLALGGGWETAAGAALVRPETRATMRRRSNWGDLIDRPAQSSATAAAHRPPTDSSGHTP